MDFSQLNPTDLYGIKAGGPAASAHGGGGDTLPHTDAMVGDGAMVPWSPDSPMFWVVILAAATALGIVGASLDVRAGRRHASVTVGD